MTDRNADQTETSVMEQADRPSGTEGEVWDLVDRKGPITFDDLMKHIGAFSRDEVYTCLQSLESEGYTVKKEIELEQGDVTYTRDMWSSDPATDHEEDSS